MMKGGTLFSGFEGVGIGMKAAGIEHAWGIEYEQDIADVARRNGFNMTVADILECDPSDFEPVDVLHASPPCPNFSVAKAGGKETELDIALGKKVADFFTAIKPRIASIENVYGYRKAESFRIIVKALRDDAYNVRWWHLNSADYGVAQTRKRLILVASRDFVPQRPPPTHQERGKHDGQLALFGDKLPPWVGWYEAIEDLIPSLPDSEFAPWQLKRLPDELKTMLLSQGISRNHHNKDYGKATRRSPSETAFTITSNRNMETVRAFVTGYWSCGNCNAGWHGERLFECPGCGSDDVGWTENKPRAFVMWSNGNLDSWGRHHVEEEEPALTVSPQTNGRARAFVVPGGNSSSFAVRNDGEPARTVETAKRGNMPRAFVFPGSNPSHGQKPERYADEPTHTLRGGRTDNLGNRAFVVASNSNADSWGDNYREGETPQFTVTERDNGRSRAAVAGRVVQMTPRALARFQSFPDWYELPDSKKVACRGIGNAVPPLMMQRIYESAMERVL